ncbi:MAG: NADH-quinone oxidoreductase subunit C [Candidatus Zixiibacteriota bacterium]|nr:MAG: NADH-quinone oxidoreductase subunit C [candidate division Zixibacteria bacterium]
MERNQLVSYIKNKFQDTVTLLESGKGESFFQIKPEDLLVFSRAIRDDERLGMDWLSCISGVDTGERFEVVYSVASVVNRIRFNYKLVLDYDKAEIESVQKIWPGANWHERELWELYGINVNNHGNLTRFLLPDNWDQGHPLRKDWDAPDFKRMPEK